MNSVRMQGVVPAVPTVASTAPAATAAPGDFLAVLMGALGPAAVPAAEGDAADTTDPAHETHTGAAADDALGVGAEAAEAIDVPAMFDPNGGADELDGHLSGRAGTLTEPEVETAAPSVERHAVSVDGAFVGRSADSADQVDGVPLRATAVVALDPAPSTLDASVPGRGSGVVDAAQGRRDIDGETRRTARGDGVVASAPVIPEAVSPAATGAAAATPQYSSASRRPVLVRIVGRRTLDGREPNFASPGDAAAVRRAVGRYAAIGRPLGAARSAATSAAAAAVAATVVPPNNMPPNTVTPNTVTPNTVTPTSAPTATSPIASAATPTVAVVDTTLVAPAATATSAPIDAAGVRSALDADSAADDETLDGDAAAVSGRSTRAHSMADARPDAIAPTAAPATPSAATVASAVASTTVTPSHRAAEGARTDQPAGLGMIGTDRVDRVRQHVSARPVQRLTVDLDDARIAVRVRGDRVSVDVLRDPDASLGQGWASDVERTLQSAMRAQESAAVRAPVERDRTVATGTAHERTNDHGPNDHPRDGSAGGRGHRGRQSRPDVPWWLTEEDE